MRPLASSFGPSFALACALALAACTSTSPATDSSAAGSVAPAGADRTEEHVASPGPSSSAARAAEADAKRFADLVNDLSEPDTYFFSDNLVTNETSYLQVAEELPAHVDAGGVYLGVGPEQNFTYIALTRPSVAFIVDIRRANMLLHLLYRAAFEEASSRSHFLALLLGRPHDPSRASTPSGGIDEVIEAATRERGTDESFDAASDALVSRAKAFGVKLSAEDEKGIRKMHRTFFDKGLGLRFELHEKNGRLYPTLEELLKAKSPAKSAGSFLASEDAFVFLREMQRGGRIVPIVGDFAGDKALPQLAGYLKSEGKTVSVFYVSNVEQYLLEPKVFAKWVQNVRALPKSDKSLFLRAYLDQGKKHPAQMEGHRTATVLSRMVDFESAFGDKKTATFYALCTEKVLAAK
jgi:hypothetical protein